jgi:hypothetical protein
VFSGQTTTWQARRISLCSDSYSEDCRAVASCHVVALAKTDGEGGPAGPFDVFSGQATTWQASRISLCSVSVSEGLPRRSVTKAGLVSVGVISRSLQTLAFAKVTA